MRIRCLVVCNIPTPLQDSEDEAFALREFGQGGAQHGAIGADVICRFPGKAGSGGTSFVTRFDCAEGGIGPYGPPGQRYATGYPPSASVLCGASKE